MVVSRRGASARAPRTQFESVEPASSSRIIVGDCVAEMSRLPASSVDVVFADPPYNLQLKGELKRPDESHVDAVNNDWDKFSSFTAYDDFTRAWLLGCRRVMKPSATIWGDRLLSQHFPRRRDHAGSRLLDPQRHRVAQIQSDAELPRPPLHQRARDHDLGGARRGETKYTFNYEALKAANEDIQARSDWLIPLCTGEERLKGQDGKKVHPTQKPEGLLARVLLSSSRPGDLILDPFNGTVHHRRGRQASWPLLCRLRARQDLRGGR